MIECISASSSADGRSGDPRKNEVRKNRQAITGIVGALILTLAGCGTLPVARVDGHLKAEPSDASVPNSPTRGNVPDTVRQVPLPPPPQARIDEVRYSITVKDVLVEDLLFAISRDTKVNIDVHPGIEGRVTLNAIDQTLRQILTRVAKQVDMRFETDGLNLVVMKDSPYLKLYRVDYVNMTRDSTASIGVQTQVVGPSTGLTGATTSGSGGQNTTQLRIDNASKNRFWDSLEKNIKDMLRDTDKLLPEGSSETFVKDQSQGLTASNRNQTTAQRSATNRTSGRANNRTETTGPGVAESQVESQSTTQTLTFREAASVIVNAETGTVFVRATLRQQEKVAEFIAQVTGSASRQVLIEATVVEVTLNDNYQSGVDWSALGLKGLGYSFTQSFITPSFPASPITGSQFFGIQYNNPNAAVGGAIKSSIKLLDTFGNTKVLSSPRITTLNNQTAVMKVVENKVYFTVTSTPGTVATLGTPGTRDTYTSTPNVVPEGFVMNVTPQISEGDIVTLSVRPSITKITGYAVDPNPAFFPAVGSNQRNPQNLIPEIQTREFETVLRIPSGQTAVLGGLMQDTFDEQRAGLPIVSRWKLIGDLTSSRNDTGRKTELVIFLRPIVIKDASVETDFSAYRRLLPDSKFFKEAEPLIPALYPASPADRNTDDVGTRKTP